MRVVIFLVSLLITAQGVLSQEIKTDSAITVQPPDTAFIKSDAPVVEIDSYAKKYDPRKAMLYSAVFPGAGQLYNKKYWKAPIVYGGFVILLSTVNYYNDLYKFYRNELFFLINDPTNPPLSPSNYTEDQLRTFIDRSRRERDFFLILNGFWYILQMVDAHVDAHLKEFDLNPKMQVRIEPMHENSMMVGRSTGIALKIKF
ncbi:MAG: DUF5683 domain-containing protein [Cyclobacteriaceae bacterium]|jgi:hypothetical protein|nr:DUF5683 domain-containing protein [Cyclobacteriaceae bacterium]